MAEEEKAHEQDADRQLTPAVVPLADARDARRFGGKAAGLAEAIAHGLPVPFGVAFAVDLVDAIARLDPRALGVCADSLASFGGASVAVRSSAVGEDGGSASFAGQHVTRLGAATLKQVLDAVGEVRASAKSESAIAYRRRLGLSVDTRIGVVIQRMVDAECAGVLFTRNPIGGADERVIEATWGLGEAVVAGRVVPDRYRLNPRGVVLARELGDKDVAIRLSHGGGTAECSVDAEPRRMFCLDGVRIAALAALAATCDGAYAGPSDVEWAFEDHRLYVLQRRPVTR